MPCPMRPFLPLLGTSVSESASLRRPAAAAIRRQVYTAHCTNRYCKTPRPLFSTSLYTTPRFPRPTTPRAHFPTSPAPAVFPSRLLGIRAMSSSSESAAVADSAHGAEEKAPEGASKTPEQARDDAAPAADAQDVAGAEEEEPKLPPLSPAQFREYNRMAEHMDHFHNHFRQVWTMIYDACEKRKRPAGMSIRQFLDEGLQFINFLTTHHSIEESYIFPMLAKRMPEFQQPGKKKAGAAQSKGSAKAAELVRQHREIHVGMDAFEDYVRRCRGGETELELTVLKTQMDSWGKVLWQHLDEEVAALGAENMRKYWSLEDMRRMRM